jgi:3'(2'), 5'-bisphosphate nucleotidase
MSHVEDARIVVSKSHRSAAVEERLRAIGAREYVPTGSVGVKVAKVASGVADGYVHPTRYAGKRWDVAAPDVILRLAGGRLTDASGAPFDYRSETLDNHGIVGANPALHAALLERVRT